MKFRLVYRGPLKPQTSGIKSGKQDLRRAFHPQLKRLWDRMSSDANAARKETQPLWNPLKFPEKAGDVGLLEKVGDFQFAPLVSQAYGWYAVAELDILFLRPSKPGELIRHGGDLDNRIKVLLDGLRRPQNIDEIPDGDKPRGDETPFHCLLQDDSLVTSLSITADQLFTEVSVDYVELTIQVTVSATQRTMYNGVIW